VTLARIDAGSSLPLSPPDVFLPEHVETTLLIAAQPQLQLQPALRSLLDYPYGCLEQTASRLYALLALGPGGLGSSASSSIALGEMIDAGLSRLWSMQTPDGGIAYWPGSQRSDLWATAYAALLAVAARNAGYAVEPPFLSGVGEYLQNALRRGHDPALDDDLRALLCRVLAALDRGQPGWTSVLMERRDQLDVAGRAHLARTWLELGRRDRAWEALDLDELADSIAAGILTAPTTTSGRLTSAVRQDALLLETLLELEPTHRLVGPLVSRLESARQRGRWGSTLETASALLALARYQAWGLDEGDYRGQVVIDGKPTAFDHHEPLRVEWPGAGGPARIDTEGRGALYVVMSTEGLLRTEEIRTYDRQLRVRRRWLDRSGAPIDGSALRVGDLVQVEVTIEAPAMSRQASVGNVAIVDALPGGLEIEHPRLLGSAGRRHTDTGGADRVAFLDDRVVIFGPAGRKTRTYRYAMRAVTSGSFTVPAIQASCMYDAGFASVHGEGHLEIGR
jgi:uncharacterized protein YfaS (alpha-2-macroglobulin family)